MTDKSKSPITGIGQGRCVTSILASEGDHVQIVTDEPYKQRVARKPAPLYRGSRPMHSSTLQMPTGHFFEFRPTSKDVCNMILQRCAKSLLCAESCFLFLINSTLAKKNLILHNQS